VIDPETSLAVMCTRLLRDLQTEPTALPLRARALPVIGAALLWAEREVVPGLEDSVTTGIGHQSTKQKMVDRDLDRDPWSAAVTPPGQSGQTGASLRTRPEISPGGIAETRRGAASERVPP
jgi:hypothetical protein